jgi:putative transposase
MRSIRRVTRNVHRWRRGDMATRWVGLAILEAGKRFHRLRGHADLKLLKTVLANTGDRIAESVAA